MQPGSYLRLKVPACCLSDCHVIASVLNGIALPKDEGHKE